MSVAGMPPSVIVAPAAKLVPRTTKSNPAAGGPETGLIENTMRGESSDVFPLGSVAVTVTCWSGSIVYASVTSKSAWPAPSVGRVDEPM